MAYTSPLGAPPGGMKLSTGDVGSNVYLNEVPGDLLLFSASNNQVLIGPVFENGQMNRAAMSINSNLVDVSVDLNVDGVTTVSSEIQLTYGQGPINTASHHWFAFSNTATFAKPAVFLGSNTLFLGQTTLQDTYLTIGSQSNTGYPMMIQTTGLNNISLFASGDIASLSDARFKTDVRPIADAVAKVCAIGGYTFAWSGKDPDNRSAGVIAQEVQAVLPEVVSTGADGKLSVSYGNLSALLIEAVKEVAGRQLLLSFDTTQPDETFRIPIPNGRPQPWRAAIISPDATVDPDGYPKCHASISPEGTHAVGKAEVPGSYHLLLLS